MSTQQELLQHLTDFDAPDLRRTDYASRATKLAALSKFLSDTMHLPSSSLMFEDHVAARASAAVLSRYLLGQEPPYQQESHAPTAKSKERSAHEGNDPELLRKENYELKIQNELLISRLADERAKGSDAIQQREKRTEELDSFLSAHRDIACANRGLLEILTGRKSDQLYLWESYPGIIDDVNESRVVVLFDVDGDPVEHVYAKDQFVGSRLPVEGGGVVAYVYIVGRPESGDSVQDQPCTEEDYPARFGHVLGDTYTF